MATLHIRRVTPRVIANRKAKSKNPAILTFGRFHAALRHVCRDAPETIKAVPRIFWISQLNLWNRGYRGSDLHKFTFEAATHAERFPMGH